MERIVGAETVPQGCSVEPWLCDSGGRPLPIDIDVRTASGPGELPHCPYAFPDARRGDAHGLICAGGDFAPSTVVAAYAGGLFPWPNDQEEYLWFSPDPRAIIPLDGLRVSRRLGRTIRSGKYRVTIDAAFETVMRHCAIRPDDGTWITESLIEGYTELHRLGWAHSIEAWDSGGELAGGLYGVCVGGMFGAESMFHLERDASKVAQVALMQHARAIGIELIDVQVLTDHTVSMGAVEIPRAEYLRRVAVAIAGEVEWRAGESVQ